MSRPSLLFRAGSLLCAVPLDDVIETMRPLPVRPLAGTPPYLRGVSVVRGRSIPVLDIAALLGGEQTDATRFIALRRGRDQVALATGPVIGVLDAAPAQPAGSTVGAGGGSLRATGDRPVPAIGAMGVYGAEPLMLLRGDALVEEVAWTVPAGSPETP